MKKIISLFILLVLILTPALNVNAEYSEKITVYSLDGRHIRINAEDFDAWQAVGWYKTPVMTVYAPDGRSMVIESEAFKSWEATGWYDYPVMTVYALDGRTMVISSSEYMSWNKVGWYSAPVMTIYAPDGRNMVIQTSDYDMWHEKGWYNTPVMTIYAPDGRTATINSQELVKWLAVGWYSSPMVTIYNAKGETKVLAATDYKQNANVWHTSGWYNYPVMNIYNLDGKTMVIQKADFTHWQSQGWYDSPVMTIFTSYGKTMIIPKKDYESWHHEGWNGIPDMPAPYLAKVKEYLNAMTMGKDTFYEKYPDDSSINSSMVYYAYLYGDMHFAFALYDVDKNGVDELVFSNNNEYGRKLIDIYTLNNGKLVKLFEECYFGDRSRLHLLSDGTLLCEGASSAFESSAETYKFNSSGNSLKTTSSFYCNTEGRNPYLYGYEYLSTNNYTNRLNKLKAKSIVNNLSWCNFASR